MVTELDARDAQILAERVTLLDRETGPRVGDYVAFKDDVTRRISYVWPDEHGNASSVQTSKSGSYYLGNGYISMSGSLYTGVPADTLTLTDEKRDGSVWFFHNDYHTAGGGIDTIIPFRVFTCSVPSTH